MDYSLLWIIILFACLRKGHPLDAVAVSTTIGFASCATIITTPSALSVPPHPYRQPLPPSDQGVQHLPDSLSSAIIGRNSLTTSVSGSALASRIASLPQLRAADGEQRAVGRASSVAVRGVAGFGGVA